MSTHTRNDPASPPARPSGDRPAAPLADLLVLDLTRVLAGPYCTMVLADLGARVIKVERPEIGDDARSIGPFVDGDSAYFTSVNRRKQSIALDLKDEEDRIVFEALLDRADVLVENFRPGTLARLGYGWTEIEARFPRLIYASTSGFGHTGPLSHRPAYDMVVQAMGGIMSLTGEAGGAPTRVGTSIGDLSAGLFTAIGILAAVNDRAQTGRGRRVDVSMLDCQVALLENAIARLRATGEVPGPIGSRHPSITPFGAFATADGSIIIAAGNDALFKRLCACLASPEWAEAPAFADNAARTENHAELSRRIESVLARESSAAWLEKLERADIPCGPINDVAQVLAHPQVKARNMVVSVKTPTGGSLEVAGNPIKLNGYEEDPQSGAAPALDQDRADLLAELGLS